MAKKTAKTKSITTPTLSTFNGELSEEEAKKIVSFKGQVMYPNTEHNRKIIASVIDKKLKALRKT
jgi:hypothetical protein